MALINKYLVMLGLLSLYSCNQTQDYFDEINQVSDEYSNSVNRISCCDLVEYQMNYEINKAGCCELTLEINANSESQCFYEPVLYLNPSISSSIFFQNGNLEWQYSNEGNFTTGAIISYCADDLSQINNNVTASFLIYENVESLIAGDSPCVMTETISLIDCF